MLGKGWDRAQVEEKQGSPSPVARGKVRERALDLAEERCEGVGVPGCYCFLNDAGGNLS